MSLKKSTLIMECALVLFALLDLSRLVYARGEPRSNSDEGAPSSSLLTSPITSSLYPAVSITPSGRVNLGKSTMTKLSTTTSGAHAHTPGVMESEARSTRHVYEKSIASSYTLSVRQSPNVIQSQAGMASFVHASNSAPRHADAVSATQSPDVLQSSDGTISISTPGHADTPSVTKSQTVLQSYDATTSLVHASVLTSSGTGTSSVLRSSVMMQSQAPIDATRHTGRMQSANVMQTQAASVSLMRESTASDTPSVTQTHHAQITSHVQVLMSVPKSTGLSSLPATGAAVTSAYYSLSTSTLDILPSQTHTASTTHVTTLLPSMEVPLQSTIQTQQNTSHLSPQASLSMQVPATKKDGSSTLHLSASQPLDEVNMTSKGSLSSITSSGLASYSSLQLLTSSVRMTDRSVFTSQDLIHPTTSVQITWHQSSSVMLPPPGPPDQPIIQVTTVLSASSVLLKWNTSSVQFAANFSVEWSVDSISWEHANCSQSLVQEACMVVQTEATVTWLKPYTNYTFRVVAQNLFGRSNYSTESKSVVTNEAAPSGAPMITAAHNLSSQEIFVAWQPPPKGTMNGKLRKYELRITEVNAQPTTLPPNKSSISSVVSSSPMSSTPVPTTPSNGGNPVTEPHEPTEGSRRRKRQIGLPVVIDVGLALSFHVPDLKIWTSYEVEVRAVTVVPGPFSKKVAVRTDEDVPRQPTQLSAKAVNSSAIFVNWTEPAKINGILVKYQVTYSEKNSSKSVKTDVGKAESVLLVSLNPFTLYTISVSAFTSKGGGNHSTLQEQTDEGPPTGPPQNVRATTNSSSSIILHWMPPKVAEQNGVITRYNIHISSSVLQNSALLNTLGNITVLIIPGLQAYTNYSFMVQAATDGGIGPYSSAVTNQTFEAEPSSPRNITAKSVNSTAIKVAWVQALHPNGAIHYKLYIRLSKDDESMNRLVYEGVDTAFVVSGLQEYVMYNFSVVSFNVKYAWTSKPIVAMEITDPAAPTGPPQNVRPITNSSSSIILHWMPPKVAEQNGVITRYNIHISSSVLQNSALLNTLGNITVLIIPGLQAYTNYSFMVQAATDRGVGPNSSAVTNQTFEAVPSPPRNITAKSVNSTAIKVAWVQALHPNGAIHYKLYIRLSKDDESMNRLVHEGVDTAFVVSGLQEYVMYSFTVVSFNVKYAWTSKPIVTMETTHPAEPSGPPQDVQTLTVSSTSIQVKWSPPLRSERNGIITHYSVQYSKTSQLGKSGAINTTDNSTSIVVPGLAIFTKYSFLVKAWNVVGAGPESEPVYNTTLQDRPSPPTKIATHTMNSSAIKVMWQAPLSPNGEIQYRLYYWQSSEGSGTRKLAYDGPEFEYTVTGLHEYVTYTFMLQAYNVKYSWSSGAINASETTHPAEPSGPPLGVVALTESSTSILVKWSPPSELDRNGIITHYIVKYNVSLGKEANITTSDNSTQYIVQQLRKYSPYYFTVQAVNKIGVGPPSVAVVNVTSEDAPGQPVIESVNAKSDSLEVMWKPPEEANGIIKTFQLCWSLSTELQNKNCTVLSGATRSYKIPNLKAFSQYAVSLAASTSVGEGPAFKNDYKTAEGVPSKPQDLRGWNTSEYSILVTWKKPVNVNGDLKGYKVFYRLPLSPDQSSKNVGLHTNITLLQLKPYTLYEVRVQAFTGAGGGDLSRVNVLTDETKPSKVALMNFKPKMTTSYAMELSWNPPSEPNGKIGYYLSFWKTSVVPSIIQTFVLAESVRNKRVSSLNAYTNYTFSVVAYNLKKNVSGPPYLISGMTKAAAPSGPPRNVVVREVTSTSLTLSWDPPLKPNGEILGYDVLYYEEDKSDKKTINENVKGQHHTITELEPWRYYRIQVACHSSGGTGPSSNWTEKRTLPGVPPPLGTLAPPDKETVSSFSFRVELAEASSEKGDVNYYQVIVRELATDNTGKAVPARNPDDYKAEDLYTYEEARNRKPQLVPYIAVEFSAKDFNDYRSFTVGDNRRTRAVAKDVSSRRRKRQQDSNSEFYNGPLEENTFYAVFQRAYVNKDVYTSSPWIEPVETAAASSPTQPPSESTSIGLVVGLILVIVIIFILIIVGIIYVRRKRTDFDRVVDDREDYSNGQPVRMKKLSRKRKSLQKRLMGSTESLDGMEDLAASRARRQPVPIDDFERHVDRMHMDGDHGFSEEYSLVQPDDEFSFQQFLNPANKYKNRYANIVAYDHSRVLLNPIESIAGSDYINANFIDGYNRQRAYVAAQGPLMETFDDFWRMMWEQMSSVIVMLTKLEERGRRKCDQYWPERDTKNYGAIQVTLKETLHMSHYTVRKFMIKHKKYPDDDRIIKQFHFTAWPDHGVPSHPTPLLSLVRHTNSANRESVGPMVVHCSAGVGRTGTFITLDVMLQRISQEDSVDVFGFVRQMRYQRNFMVQTEAQYVFIHDALLEAITCGVTEVEAKDLGSRIRELRQIDPETGYTYLENEFCRLAKEENHPVAFKSASLNCNAAKNRYANILPFESTRVHLKMRPGEMGSDYINANFIDGYCQPRAYVATQAPVPDTFEDFWRLIWEQEAATVVMLTREEEAGKVKCHHYWPSEGSRLYGVILVELVEEGSFGDYISRKFKLTHTEAKESRTVTQFQYIDWPDTGLPESGVGIVDLIGQVQKWQQQSGNTIIVIHCSGGVGRTGVFCGISMMIERLKAEGVIDVFQTVQAMRLQRPAMVQTAEQYEFCYTTLQEYLDSFDLYANFQ